MSYDIRLSIPEDSQRGQLIASLAARQHITPEEVLTKIVDEVLKTTLQNEPTGEAEAPKRSYASFFGVAKGRPGAHGSPEAADRYIEELRNAW